MKIFIGPYTNWFGIYQLFDILQYFGVSENKCHDLAHNFSENTYIGGKVADFLVWIDTFKKRKIKIHIDPWDTWSMDHTLALIIHPMLVQLKEKNHGFAMVDDEDVPEELRSTAVPDVEIGEPDNNAEKRWDYVMDELIWAFAQYIDDEADIYDKDVYARINNAMKLFGKYYRALWD